MRVGLFITCFNDALFPRTGEAVVTLLERLGHEVTFEPAQTCCGQLHWTTGYHREAAGLARRFADVCTRLLSENDLVVTPSASCAAMVRESYARLLPELAAAPAAGPAAAPPAGPVVGDPVVGDVVVAGPMPGDAPRPGGWRDNVYELSEFLVDVLGVIDVGARFPHRVTYHPTCHSLRALKVGDRPLRLLSAVRGIDLVELPAATECCGFGGAFALKNADVSVAIVADKIRHIRTTAADVVCAIDNACLTHIGGALSRLRSGVRVMHLAEILAETA